MLRIYYRTEISSAHRLELPYPSKCRRWHGHNYIIEVWAETQKVDENGMVVDYTHLKKIIHKLDHRKLNNYLKQPTAENIAKKIGVEITQNTLFSGKLKVRVWEDRDSWAEYEAEVK